MAHSQRTVQIYRQNVWPTYCGQIWLNTNQTITSIQQPLLGPGNGRRRRIEPIKLAIRNELCKPSISFTAKSNRPYMCKQSAILASQNMVLQVEKNSSVSTPSPAKTNKHVHWSSGYSARTAQKPKMEIVCLKGEWTNNLINLKCPKCSKQIYNQLKQSLQKHYIIAT